MRKLLILLMLGLQTACIQVVENVRPPKFRQFQEVQTVENKYPVTIIGTKCDVPADQASFASCRYLVRLKFKGMRTLMFEEGELEELPNK
jgi:hypothetical protein